MALAHNQRSWNFCFGFIVIALLFIHSEALDQPRPGYFFVKIRNINWKNYVPKPDKYVSATYNILKAVNAIKSLDGGIMDPNATAASSIEFSMVTNWTHGQYVRIAVEMIDLTGAFINSLEDRFNSSLVASFALDAKIAKSNARISFSPNPRPLEGKPFFCGPGTGKGAAAKWEVPELCTPKVYGRR